MTPKLSTIYTCCLGLCDLPFSVHNLRLLFPDIRFIAFVDLVSFEFYKKAGWDVEILNELTCTDYSHINSPRFRSRIPKLSPHLASISNQYALWVDANVHFGEELIFSIIDFIHDTNNFSFACFSHPKRKFLVQEIFYCYLFGKLSLLSFCKSVTYNLQFLLLDNCVFWGGVILWNLTDLNSTITLQNELLSSTSKIGRDQLCIYTASKRSFATIVPLPNAFLKYVEQVPHARYQKHELDFLSRVLTSSFSKTFFFLRSRL